MKNILSIAFVIGILNAINAQGLTQSADGKSAILFKGTSLSLDIAKADVSFGINNLVKSVKLSTKKDNFQPIYGISISAKNKEGIGDLFSKGKFVPNADANFFAGLSISNKFISDMENEKQQLKDVLEILSKKNMVDFKNTMDNILDERLSEFEDVKTVLKSNTSKGVGGFRRALSKIDLKQDKKLERLINSLDQDLNELDDLYQKKESETMKQLTDLHKKLTYNNLRILNIYTFGGLNASSFKRSDSINTSELSKSFIKEEFRGGNFGFGINYQIKQWRFGITYEYVQTNNFDMLNKAEYTLSTVNSSGNQSLEQENAITAYYGKYGQVEINRLNADVIYSLRLDKDANTFCYLNPYLRSNLASRNTALLVNTVNIGSGFYFFDQNSKFIGGLYIELPDVDNKIERSKPVADQNLNPAVKRLTFGIVTKFSLSSIIKFQ